jgi:hypothetical protein
LVLRHQPGAEAAVAPVSRLLVDQVQVIRFCWHVFGIAGVEPSWDVRRGEPWMLSAPELNAIERVKAEFRAVVQVAVDEIDAAGAGLVPSWAGDYAMVGELLFLDVDWNLPPRDLAEVLQPPGIGAVHPDASATSHRRGSGERASNNIGALRRAYEEHLYGPAPRVPYARGGKRVLPVPTRRRREALVRVLRQWPDATASQIFTSFGDRGLQRGGRPRSPGGCLRQLLEEDAGPGEIVRRPSKSTLHADLIAVRAAAAGQDQSG